MKYSRPVRSQRSSWLVFLRVVSKSVVISSANLRCAGFFGPALDGDVVRRRELRRRYVRAQAKKLDDREEEGVKVRRPRIVEASISWSSWIRTVCPSEEVKGSVIWVVLIVLPDWSLDTSHGS